MIFNPASEAFEKFLTLSTENFNFEAFTFNPLFHQKDSSLYGVLPFSSGLGFTFFKFDYENPLNGITIEEFQELW